MRHVTMIGFVLLALGAIGRPAAGACPEDAGAAVAAACPCEGRDNGSGGHDAWKNHGKYVSCVVRFRNDLRRQGCLTREANRDIARCAARSTCGKEGATLCCYYAFGDCSDPAPGDLVVAGTCSNDADVACDTDADCTTSRIKVRRNDLVCTAQGGVAVGGGSVCAGCPAPATP